MNLAALLIAAALATTGFGLAVVLVRRKAARLAAEPLEVIFELQLPSKWAAELTSQTLVNTGIQSRVVAQGASWSCRVTKRMDSDRSQIERTCRELNQIAASRGGGCAAHRMTQGSRREVFEH